MGGERRLLFVGYLLAIVGSMSYGLNPLFALPLYDKGLTPLSVLFYRYAFAVVGMAAMMLIERHPFRMTRRETLLTLLMGVLFSLSSLFLFLSFRYMDAGIASTILFTYPLLVVLISWLFLHERISRATLFGLLFATAGILMLYRGSDGQTLSALGVTWLSGCSALTPSTKSQSMTVTALGFPAITVVTTTSQAATNSGDDEGENAQTTSADVKPDVDASVVPK